MKNIRVIVPVLICLALCFYAIGCGSNATSGGGGGSTGTSFTIVDPHVAGMRMFFDTNFDGTWEAGEISSDALGSDDNGVINFASLPTMDANMMPLPGYKGKHLGVTYEGFVARYFSTIESGALFITPTTSLMTKSNGAFRFTADQIADILSTEAGITLDAISEVINDPMEGIDALQAGQESDHDLRKIRASLCIYSFIRVMDFIQANLKDTISFTSIEASSDVKHHLGVMGMAVRGTINKDLIDAINASMEAGAIAVGAPLPPKVTAGDVAKTAVIITNRIIDKIITSTSCTYEPTPPEMSDWAGQVGIRFYLQRTRNDPKIYPGFTMGPGSTSVFIDSKGVPITYNEVNTFEAWKIDSSDHLVGVP